MSLFLGFRCQASETGHEISLEIESFNDLLHAGTVINLTKPETFIQVLLVNRHYGHGSAHIEVCLRVLGQIIRLQLARIDELDSFACMQDEVWVLFFGVSAWYLANVKDVNCSFWSDNDFFFTRIQVEDN